MSMKSGSVANFAGAGYALASPIFNGLTTSYGAVARIRLPDGYAAVTNRTIVRERTFASDPAQVPLLLGLTATLMPMMRVATAGSFVTATGPTAITPGQWATLAVWRSGTTISVSLNGGTPGTATISDVIIASDIAMIGATFTNVPALYSPTEFFQGELLFLDSFAPFDPVDLAAIVAAGSYDSDTFPVLSAGSTRIEFDQFDGPVSAGRIGGRVTRFVKPPATWSPSPIARSTATPAFPTGRIGEFNLGGKTFKAAPGGAPTYAVGPRRAVLDAASSMSADGPIISGRNEYYVSFSGHFYAANTSTTSPVDGRIYSETKSDGSGIELVSKPTGLVAFNHLGAGGVIEHAIESFTGQYGRITDYTVTENLQVPLAIPGNEDQVRLTLAIAESQRDHDISDGDSVVLHGGTGEWAANQSVHSTLVESVRLFRGVAATTPAYSAPSPPNGLPLYGTGRACVQDRAGAANKSESLAFGLGIERKNGVINIYSRGKLIGTGSVPAGVVGPTSGVTCWLGKRPDSAMPASVSEIRGIAYGYGLTDDQKKTIQIKHSVHIQGRDSQGRSQLILDARCIAGVDRQSVSENEFLWRITDKATGELIEPEWTHPTTGQAYGLMPMPWGGVVLGSANPTAVEEYRVELFVWLRLYLRDGTLNPNRGAEPIYCDLGTVYRRPFDARWTTTYVDALHNSASDDATNDGSNPATPLLSLTTAFARAGRAYSRIVLAPGIGLQGTTPDMTGVVGPIRVESADPVIPAKLLNLRLSSNSTVHMERIHIRNRLKAGGLGSEGATPEWTMHKCLSASDDGATGGTVELGLDVGTNRSTSYALFDDCYIRNNPAPTANAGYTIFAANLFTICFNRSTFISKRLPAGGWAFRAARAYAMSVVNLLEGESFPDDNNEWTLRNSHGHIYVSDTGRQHVGFHYSFLGGITEVAGGEPVRHNIRVQRSTFMYIRPRAFLAAIVAHCRATTTSDSNFDVPRVSGSSEINGRMRALGNQTRGGNDWTKGSPTTVATGPYRNAFSATSDQGPDVCPDVAEVHIIAGLAAARLEGYPHGGLSLRRIDWQYGPPGAGANDWLAVKAGNGGTYAILDLPPGTWITRAGSGGLAAFGAPSTAFTIT